jgi:uroporphyrinogen-III synthase
MREVLLVRALGGDDRDAEALRSRAVPFVEDPFLTVAACTDDQATARATHVLDAIAVSADWLVVTSQAALRALSALRGDDALRGAVADGVGRGLRVAAVGPSSAEALKGLGAADVLVPSPSTAAALRDRLAVLPPGSIIAPQGSQAMKGLASGLREHGWTVDEQVVYETTTVTTRPPTADRLAEGRLCRSPPRRHGSGVRRADDRGGGDRDGYRYGRRQPRTDRRGRC